MYLRCKARASLQVRARLLADDVGRAAARRLQPTARDHLGSELSTVVNSDTPPIDRRGPRSTTPGGRNGARWTANLHRESNASQHERLDLVPCSGTLARHRRRSVACAAERRSPVSQVRLEHDLFPSPRSACFAYGSRFNCESVRSPLLQVSGGGYRVGKDRTSHRTVTRSVGRQPSPQETAHLSR